MYRQKTMNVVYALTRNYYKKILPTIKSLAEYHPEAQVYILAQDNQLPFEIPFDANVIDVSGQTYFTEDCVNIGSYFGGYINLLKVWLPEILPDIDRVLYLDIDTIVCDRLDDLYNIDMTDMWIAAVPEYLARHGREHLFGDMYYNAGVMVINLDQMRKDNIMPVMAEYLNTVPQPFADQDAWNKFGVENDKIVTAPLRYNENMSCGYTDDPAIVHYCGIHDWYEDKHIKRREYLDKYLDLSQKYMIHTYNDREWYVNDYLYPSLVEQGIPEDDIIIWQDKACIGNLLSFVSSCRWITENLEPYNSTWHLQDDVCIAPNFREIAEKGYDGVANAFCNEIFDGERTNYFSNITVSGMWFSFQCILIPNRYLKGFTEWFDSGKSREEFPEFVDSGKCDDSLFREYMMRYEPKVPAFNIWPCIVDHVDYLIGGTTINHSRGQTAQRKAYWRDKDGLLDKAVAELERKLTEDGRRVCNGSDVADSVPQGVECTS